jgi:hypothetical protein
MPGHGNRLEAFGCPRYRHVRQPSFVLESGRLSVRPVRFLKPHWETLSHASARWKRRISQRAKSAERNEVLVGEFGLAAPLVSHERPTLAGAVVDTRGLRSKHGWRA